jgi:hypothetical protein
MAALVSFAALPKDFCCKSEGMLRWHKLHPQKAALSASRLLLQAAANDRSRIS